MASAASGERFDRRLDAFDARMELRFAAIDARFDGLERRFDLFEHRLLALIDRRLRWQTWISIWSIIAAVGVAVAAVRL